MSNQSKIRELAGVHLGKAGDGSVVNPYQTPDAIDPSLLVAVPRQLNREDYGIDGDALPFIGFDVWNCYEVSALTENGYPVSGVLRIRYPASSPFIVESKSLKLYLNSFNMHRLGGSVQETIRNIKSTVTEALSELLDCAVGVNFFNKNAPQSVNSLHEKYSLIEDQVNVEHIKFDSYNETPELIKLDDGLLSSFARSPRTTAVAQRLTTNALRSNCQITNQPDWGDVFIYVKGTVTLDPASVLQYIVSMRNESHFHEEIVECMFKRLYDLLPRGTDIAVGALYTRRGGIDINPIRATGFSALDEFSQVFDLSQMQIKTPRQ